MQKYFKFPIFTLLCLVIFTYSYTIAESEEINLAPIPSLFIDKQPIFEYGADSLQNYFYSYYGKVISKIDWEGYFAVMFVVDSTGKAIFKQVITKPETEIFNRTMQDCIDNMSKWIPGENKGNKVHTLLSIPIIQKLY